MKTTDSRLLRKRLVIASNVLDEIHEFIGKHRAERGGILGCGEDDVVRYFAPDTNAHCSAAAYGPNIEAMNQQIKNWKSEGIRFVGFVHSHPPGYKTLSSADRDYAGRILSAFSSLERLELPIVMTEPDCGTFEIVPFVAIPSPNDRQSVSFSKAELVIERMPQRRKRTAPVKTVRTSQLRNLDIQRQVIEPRYYGDFPSWWKLTASRLNGQQASTACLPKAVLKAKRKEWNSARHNHAKAEKYFERVKSAYDLPRLSRTRLIIIGNGGAVSLIRDCARAGFGEFVLIDPDEITASNVGTQSVDPGKIGLFKVDALAQELRAINPACAVVSVANKIEAINDHDFELLSCSPLRGAYQAGSLRSASNYPLRPLNTLLLVLTDNFEAQARGHRLGLEFGLPTICAQEYQEGRGAEITFTIPGVTPACHRCITSSRYRAYLSEGYRNTVTSDGAPIFAAQLLNAVLGHIVLAVAHHGTNHPRFGGLISRLGNRNLVLLRMEPDFDTFLGCPTFSRRLAGAAQPDAFFMLDSLFLPQTPDCRQSETRPACPDCGGSGDLRRCIGTFSDTRIMRPENPSRQAA